MFRSIVAPVVLVSLFWIIISIFTTFNLNSMLDVSNHSLAADMTTIESAWAMRRDTWRLQNALLETTQINSPQAYTNIKALEEDFRKTLTQARRTSLTASEIAAVNLIESRFAVYSERIHGVLDNEAAYSGGLTSFDHTAFSALAMALSDACRNLSEINERLISQATARNQRLYSIITWIRFGAIIVGPAAGLLLGIWIARRLQHSVSQISAKLSRASGALAEQPPDNSKPSDALPELDHQAEIIARRVNAIVNELEKTRKQVIHSERLAAVGELAAGIAHEIRNPLTSIKLLIQNTVQPHSAHVLGEKQATVLLQEISRMESLVENLLNFARPPRLQLIRHDLRVTLRRALNLVGSHAQQRSVRLEEDFPDAPVLFTGDPEQLLLIFLNLALNGIEAVAEGTVTVSLHTDEQGCLVRFRDTGRGIDPAIRDRLFEPFITTKERGTGLGLAICRRIVHEHGGTIEADNAPEGGAVFMIKLPLKKEIAADTSSSTAVSQTCVAGDNRPSILVTE